MEEKKVQIEPDVSYTYTREQWIAECERRKRERLERLLGAATLFAGVKPSKVLLDEFVLDNKQA